MIGAFERVAQLWACQMEAKHALIFRRTLPRTLSWAHVLNTSREAAESYGAGRAAVGAMDGWMGVGREHEKK